VLSGESAQKSSFFSWVTGPGSANSTKLEKSRKAGTQGGLGRRKSNGPGHGWTQNKTCVEMSSF